MASLQISKTIIGLGWITALLLPPSAAAQIACDLPDATGCTEQTAPEPWADAYYYTTGEPAWMDVLSNDRHPLGVPLELTAVEGVPTGVTVTMQADRTLTAVVDRVGEWVTFEYRVAAGVGQEATAQVTLIPAERKGAPVIGCYDPRLDGCNQALLDNFDSFAAAGFTAVDVGPLWQQPEKIWQFDAVVLDNTDCDEVRDAYEQARSEVFDWVAAGGVLAVHNCFAGGIDQLVPGEVDGADVVGLLGNDLEIPQATTVTEGLGNGDLDNALYSYDSYLSTGDLPPGAEVILTTEAADRVVAFAYPYGQGWVYYSSVPLSAFLGLYPGPQIFESRRKIVEIYAPNVVRFAEQLRLRP